MENVNVSEVMIISIDISLDLYDQNCMDNQLRIAALYRKKWDLPLNTGSLRALKISV